MSSDQDGLRFSHWLWVALAGVALAVGALAWSWFQRHHASISIAPLTNLSQDPTNDYFADGLTDEIIRNLSIIDVLAVRYQTSSFVFKGKPRNIRDAGKQLDADYILEGSVLRIGRQLRINAQFGDPALDAVVQMSPHPVALLIRDELHTTLVPFAVWQLIQMGVRASGGEIFTLRSLDNERSIKRVAPKSHPSKTS